MGGFLGFHLQHRREEQDGFPQVFHGEERQHVGERQGHDQIHPPEGRQDEQWLSGTATHFFYVYYKADTRNVGTSKIILSKIRDIRIEKRQKSMTW
jgi:hypothetical protein